MPAQDVLHSYERQFICSLAHLSSLNLSLRDRRVRVSTRLMYALVEN